MACTASIEQIKEELHTIEVRKKKMEHITVYIEALKKRNLFLIRSCNTILILLFFSFLAVQFFTSGCTTQLQQIITSMVAIGKWSIAIVIIFLYAYANVMEEGVKT